VKPAPRSTASPRCSAKAATAPPWCGCPSTDHPGGIAPTPTPAPYRSRKTTAILSFLLAAGIPAFAQEPDTADLVRRRDALVEMHRDNPALGRDIAMLETLLGHRALREQRHDEAIARYRSALVYHDDLEPARVGLILSLMKTDQLDYALSESQTALARHPGSADLLRLYGEALYRSNRLEEALSAWRRAVAQGAGADLEGRIAQVQNEQQKTGSYLSTEASHFTLQIDGERPAPALESEIVTVLEETYSEFARTLDHLPAADITVILYTRQMFRDITQAGPGVEGLFDGKVRLPLGGLTRLTPGARATVRHELAHAFIHSKTRGRAPRWLHEGIAQWLEPSSARSYGAALAREARRRPPDAPVPFSYPAALSQVEYLVETYGAHDIPRLLDRLRDAADLDSALRDTYRVDSRGLGSEWSLWLARAFPPGER
jgi:tetratricopeptide (TPR) repeat protein